MSTFLELCTRLHQDLRVGGSLASVVGQTGMLKRVVDSISKANRKIQRRKTNWKFLWSEWELTLTTDSEYSPPDGLGSFDETSFWIDVGTDDVRMIQYVDYKEYRDVYRTMLTDTDEIEIVTIKPNGRHGVSPSPNTDSVGKIITCDYWRSPVELTANNQISQIPPQFHDAIIAQAKMYFADIQHDTGWYNSSFAEHEMIYAELKAHSLPGKEDDRKSESSINRVIEVM